MALQELMQQINEHKKDDEELVSEDGDNKVYCELERVEGDQEKIEYDQDQSSVKEYEVDIDDDNLDSKETNNKNAGVKRVRYQNVVNICYLEQAAKKEERLESELCMMKQKLQEKDAKFKVQKKNLVADKEDGWLKEKEIHERKLQTTK